MPDTMKSSVSISSQEIIKNKQCGYDVRKPGYVSIICLIYNCTILIMHETFNIHDLYLYYDEEVDFCVCNYFCQDNSHTNLIHACISITSELNEDSSHKIEVISSMYEINMKHVLVFPAVFVQYTFHWVNIWQATPEKQTEWYMHLHIKCVLLLFSLNKNMNLLIADLSEIITI